MPVPLVELSAVLQQTRQPTIQSEKYQCHIDTVSSPGDGHKDARNMYKSWKNILRSSLHIHLKKEFYILVL